MREHKYRAWDKKNKVIVKVWGINYKDFEGNCIVSFFAVNPVINGEYILRAENAELLEYTGLKDKNDVEIYEGDILRVGSLGHLRRDSSYKDQQKVNERDMFYVKCLKSGFTLRDITTPLSCDIPNLHNSINNYSFWNGQNDLEIIGNIHENPELLKEK